MSNIKNFNFNNLKLKLSNSDYWDFFITNDDTPIEEISDVSSGTCLVVNYDFNDPSIYSNNSGSTIESSVYWNKATNSGYTGYTYGLTGIDNGAVYYVKDINDESNQNLIKVLTGTTLIIPSGNTKLIMNLVSGSTGEYQYPVEVVNEVGVGDYLKLCGGFYQGFFKIDGSDYEVLPTRVNKGWVAEFWLKPTNDCVTTGNTLNDLYPNNKGFFFYMGSRAENKFWNQFYGNNTGCTSECVINSGSTDCSGFTGSVTNFCTTIKENNVAIIGDYGFMVPLSPPRLDISLITNNFLIYGRASDSSKPRLTGTTDTIIYNNLQPDVFNKCFCNLSSSDGLGTKTVCNYDGNGIPVAKFRTILTNKQNPFLIYGRGSGCVTGCTCNLCSGPKDGLGSETIYSYSGSTTDESEINYNIDIIDNAIGFRITDDGSIGYRLLTLTGSCYTHNNVKYYTSGITIQEDYSLSGTIKQDEWSYVAIRFSTNYLDDCLFNSKGPRKGKLMIYVNGKLIKTFYNFPEFIAKRLDEYKAKQIGVPFNFSLGGGSQGLLENQTFDGPDEKDKGLPIEKNFAGSFIGGISQFKFNVCDFGLSQIKYNFNKDIERYGLN